MKDKLGLPDELKVRQDVWEKSPCKDCLQTPCCVHLPLTALHLESRTDFLNIALLSCYNRILIGLKNTFEWTVYYISPCRYLNSITSQCTIHTQSEQSIICKSYDAHRCWYKPAFENAQNEKVIFINLERLLYLEQKTDLLKNGFIESTVSWEALKLMLAHIPFSKNFIQSRKISEYQNRFLEYQECSAEKYLFFPPFEKPARKIHIELMKFRLGFPGVSLAYSDNYLAYMVQPQLNRVLLKQLVLHQFPGVQPHHGQFSFFQAHKEKCFYSALGEKWLILKKEHLSLLGSFSEYDSFGNIKRLPDAKVLSEYIFARTPRKPDRVA